MPQRFGMTIGPIPIRFEWEEPSTLLDFRLGDLTITLTKGKTLAMKLTLPDDSPDRVRPARQRQGRPGQPRPLEDAADRHGQRREHPHPRPAEPGHAGQPALGRAPRHRPDRHRPVRPEGRGRVHPAPAHRGRRRGRRGGAGRPGGPDLRPGREDPGVGLKGPRLLAPWLAWLVRFLTT